LWARAWLVIRRNERGRRGRKAKPKRPLPARGNPASERATSCDHGRTISARIDAADKISRSLNEGGAPVSTGAFDFGKEQAERVYRLDKTAEN
jgi:hypothetical protein